jgi:hypothetical protein
MDFKKIIQYIREMEKYNIHLTTTEVILNILMWENKK